MTLLNPIQFGEHNEHGSLTEGQNFPPNLGSENHDQTEESGYMERDHPSHRIDSQAWE